MGTDIFCHPWSCRECSRVSDVDGVGLQDSWEDGECFREGLVVGEDARCFFEDMDSSELFLEEREQLPACWSVELKRLCVPEADSNFSTDPGVDRAGLKPPWADGKTFNSSFENWEFASVPKERDLSPRSSWADGKGSVLPRLSNEGFLTSCADVDVP